MTPPLPPFAALRAFDAVGQAGGIRKAAAALGVSHAIVSRHITGLEGLLGTGLLNRRTGQLTEAGRAYHARIGAALAEIASATQAAKPLRGEGLTIWCSPGFALHWLTRRLPGFAAAGRRVMIDLRSTDTAPDFDRNEVDGDIRYQYDGTATPAKGVRVEELARPLVFPVAAPGLLARLARPVATLADLRALPLIQEASDSEWLLWLRAQGDDSGQLPPRVARYGQAHLALAAARAGQGVALANHFLVAEDLAAGHLLRVLPTAQPLRPVALGAYVFRCARARWHDPAMARFAGWLRGAVAREGAAQDAGGQR